MNLDPDPLSSDSSESLSLDPRAREKKRTKKKKRRKHWKDESSDPSSSNDSYLSDDSHYRRKQRKDKKHRKKSIWSDYAQLERQNCWRQHISRRLSGFKWMRIQSSVIFIFSHLLIHLIWFFTVQRNLWSPSWLSKNRRGGCYWGLCKKCYQKTFAC